MDGANCPGMDGLTEGIAGGGGLRLITFLRKIRKRGKFTYFLKPRYGETSCCSVSFFFTYIRNAINEIRFVGLRAVLSILIYWF